MGYNRKDIESNFEKIYRNFRLRLYKYIFGIIGEREGSLTVTEFFAVETIGLLDNPTIGEFAECLSITSSHAAYKVRQLVEKGYVVKTPTEDKRTFRLGITEKFTKFYHEDNSYGKYIFEMLSNTMSADDLEQTDALFKKFVQTIEGQKELK
ncbi:MAG: winged helix DNA-binding protein [Clostridia bacterium]|jgi:DNA-binding MarR family transcriptional regulator|nr:winged helix DNA-binding protein [Clostridia bacterium]